ncbi:hypothetical protein M728_003402 [Ensifer sp. WSM1721]|uniref:hypothetical protein n=1 Tax=Ensifer sp. WSM1721 TaxID=1041159 RepID=UPI0004B35BB1|nr:hypothetical protein [Ensifer sp. WSM1721]
MLTPIVTIRNAIGAGEDATPSVHRPSLPAGPRAEAIQKILDALILHLSGEEVLSKDALVKLIEDLALILKFPPLPQESGRAFVRRLINLLEAMPLPERIVLERQLNGRSLVQRVALLAAMPMSRGGASPPDQTPLRSLPLPSAVLPSFPTVRALPTGDVALLQALLRETYGADTDSLGAREMLEDKAPVAESEETSRTEPQRMSKTAANARSSRPTETATAGRVGAGLAQERTAAVEPPLPEGSEGGAQEVLTDHITVPQPTGTGEAANSETPLGATSENVEAAATEADLAMPEGSIEEVVDSLESDGTYGLPRAGEHDGQRMPRAPVRSGTESPTPRVSVESVKAIIQESLVLPATAEAGQPAMAESVDASPREADTAPRARGSATPNGNVATGHEAPGEHASADGEDVAFADVPPWSRPRQAGEDAGTPQAIARLVEFGLPREAIPFTLVPYPPAPAEIKSEADEADRRERDDHEADARGDEGEQEGRDQAQEHAGGGEGDQEEEPAATDAYDLYRKLGGLG